jgi:hypothetical protein
MNPAAISRAQHRVRQRHQRRPAYPARALHLVDIENLAGSASPDPGQVRELHRLYHRQVGPGAMDQVVVASSHLMIRNAGDCWPGARYLLRSGPDGADLELLAVIERERVAERFASVMIASGDGIFTAAAVRLAAAGCQVTVISRRATLSKRLALAAASNVIYLDPPAAARCIGPAQIDPAQIDPAQIDPAQIDPAQIDLALAARAAAVA